MPQGLAAVDKYYADYGARARELKNQGKRIIGYICALAPPEIISAAGFVPFRIKGDVNEAITKADTEVETIVCRVVRSYFDVAMKGRYNFLDGLVVPHACDSIARTYQIWKPTLNLPYTHFINTPHLVDDTSLEFFRNELEVFRKSLGGFAGKEISDKSISQAVETYNQYRANVRELYELRKSDPPKISGAEVTKVLVAANGLPVEESTKLLNEVIAEVKKRNPTGQKSKRIMIVGAELDDTTFINIVEETGAHVVVDDLCIGTKDNWNPVDVTRDPMDGIAERYLRKVYCPRTYWERTGTYEQYLELRFGHIRRFIKDFNVDGVILYIYKYCDPYGFEVPQVKSYIESLNKPVLYLEDEYSTSTMGRLKTRVQAYLEMIS